MPPQPGERAFPHAGGDGDDIISRLRGSTTGFAVPAYIVDTPYGKVPVERGTIVQRDEDAVYLRSHDGRVWREPNARET